MFQRNARLTAAMALVLAATSTQAQGQAGEQYPARPVRVLVPYVPGGASDIMARTIVAKTISELGQNAIVDNRPGGNATIGTQMAASAPPDGYTLLVVDAAFTIGPSVQINLRYDPVRNFSPITMLATTSPILVVHPSVPARSVKELIELAKVQSGRLTYATTGSGTNAHLAFAQMKLATGMDAIHVPYKGGAAQINALLSGEVTMALALTATIVPQIKAGRARALAVSSPKRLAIMPELPTLQELGVPVVVQSFYGLVSPAGTPASIVRQLNEAVVRQLKSQESGARLDELQFQLVGDTPAQFGEFIQREIQKWSRIVKATGVKVD